MEKLHICGFGLIIFFFSTLQLTAQSTDNTSVKVQRYTIMEKFAPDIMPTAEERRQKKIKHLADTELKARVLDTMDISNRKRKRLLIDLYKTPYSDRLKQALAEVNFEDVDDVDQ